MTIRVIGLGNALRGDDAAGLEVARRLEKARVPGLDVRACTGDAAAAILDAWRDADQVVLVDAARSGRPPGTIRRLTPHQAARARHAVGTHDFGLADALALSEALGERLPPCVVYLIDGRDFRLGAPLSDEVLTAVTLLAATLTRLLGEAVAPRLHREQPHMKLPAGI